jgi:hypothetical protein
MESIPSAMIEFEIHTRGYRACFIRTNTPREKKGMMLRICSLKFTMLVSPNALKHLSRDIAS